MDTNWLEKDETRESQHVKGFRGKHKCARQPVQKKRTQKWNVKGIEQKSPQNGGAPSRLLRLAARSSCECSQSSTSHEASGAACPSPITAASKTKASQRSCGLLIDGCLPCRCRRCRSHPPPRCLLGCGPHTPLGPITNVTGDPRRNEGLKIQTMRNANHNQRREQNVSKERNTLHEDSA